MLNDAFIGDTQNVLAVKTKLAAYFTKQPRIKEYQDRPVTNAVTLLTKDLDENQHDQHVLLISGSHGLDFLNEALKDPNIQSLITARKLIISWGGHQEPKDLKSLKDSLAVVSLLQESIDESLVDTFEARLVSTKMVPNTLNEEILRIALAEWNKNASPEDVIPNSTDGYIGVFLGGDAPYKGNYKYYTEEKAFEHGKALGLEAKKTGKFLVATPGPRISQFYPESPNPKNPVFRRFNTQGNWVAFKDLTEKERNTEPLDAFKAHAPDAPLDSVSAAFIKGIESSGLKRDRYKFFNFLRGKPSAYKAITSALYSRKNSVAYFSGDSNSYTEIGCFIPESYVFEVGSMNDKHKEFFTRIVEELDLVGKVSLSGGKVTVVKKHDQAKRLKSLETGLDQDAQKIADEILKYITLSIRDKLNTASMGMPLTWVANSGSTATKIDPSKSSEAIAEIEKDNPTQFPRAPTP